MGYFAYLILSVLVLNARALQVTLLEPVTCFSFETQQQQQLRQIYYNYDVSAGGPVILEVTDPDGRIVNSSRENPHLTRYLKVHTITANTEYKFCFHRHGEYPVQVQFEVIDEMFLIQHIAGKEDMLKLIWSAKRLMQHIEKVNVNQRALMLEHDRRSAELKSTGQDIYFNVAVKIIMLFLILVTQIFLTRHFYK